MTDRVTHRHRLAANAVKAAFTLVARRTVSSATMEIIEVNRRLRGLQEGDEGLLRHTLQSLNSLAGSTELFVFRLVMAALTQSLPRICATHVTARDLRMAALDLRRLENEAICLHAPDVAAKLVVIIDAILEQVAGYPAPALKENLH